MILKATETSPVQSADLAALHSLPARSHPRPALPPWRVHRGRGLPGGPLHPREALVLVVVVAAVAGREAPRRQQGAHVVAGRRAHQHAAARQRRGEPPHRQRRRLRAAAAGQYRLSGGADSLRLRFECSIDCFIDFFPLPKKGRGQQLRCWAGFILPPTPIVQIGRILAALSFTFAGRLCRRLAMIWLTGSCSQSGRFFLTTAVVWWWKAQFWGGWKRRFYFGSF